jgi:hypothetical protein
MIMAKFLCGYENLILENYHKMILKQQKLDFREQSLDSDCKIKNDDIRSCIEIKNLNEIEGRTGRRKWEAHVK